MQSRHAVAVHVIHLSEINRSNRQTDRNGDRSLFFSFCFSRNPARCDANCKKNFGVLSEKRNNSIPVGRTLDRATEDRANMSTFECMYE